MRYEADMNAYRLENKVPVRCADCEISFEDVDRRVALTQIGSYKVSTVFLVLDHNFTHEGPPILFESMCFSPDDEEEWCERCSTWEQAEDMHERMVDRLRDKLKSSEMMFSVFDVRGQDDALRNGNTDVGRVVSYVDFRLGDSTIDECRRVALSLRADEEIGD